MVKAGDARPFARFLPDLSIVLVRNGDGRTRLYSLIHNREHECLASRNVLPVRGLPDRAGRRAGRLRQPVVPEAKIEVFSGAVAYLKSAAGYERLVDSFGVHRSDERFWSIYDKINASHLANDPVRSGISDAPSTRI